MYNLIQEIQNHACIRAAHSLEDKKNTNVGKAVKDHSSDVRFIKNQVGGHFDFIMAIILYHSNYDRDVKEF